MTQNEIEAFLAVIDQGSISAAAEGLHISQPTISGRIKSLETELEVTLFDRNRGQKNTRLTLQGKEFEPFARKWMRLWDDTCNALHYNSLTTITITTSPSVNTYLMPAIYARMSEKAKQCSFSFLGNHYYESYRMVESGEADFGIISNSQFARDLKLYPLYNQEMVLLTNSDSNLPRYVDPSSLDPGQELYVDWDDNFGKWHKYWFGSSAKVPIKTSNISFIEQYLHLGKSWAIVPLIIARRICMDSSLSFYHLKDAPPYRVVSLISRADVSEYPVMGELLGHMKDLIVSGGGRWLYN